MIENIKKKREYRSGHALSTKEIVQRYKKRKYADNKELRVFIPTSLKQEFSSWCKNNNITQTDFIVNVLTKHLNSV